MADPDLERIISIAAGGLERSREDTEGETDLHLDTFAIVTVWAWKDEDGQECEGYGIWSETRRTHVQAGILIAALQRLAEGGGSD